MQPAMSTAFKFFLMTSIKSTTLHLKDYAKTFIMQEKFDKGCCLQYLKAFDKQRLYAIVRFD